MNKSAKGGQAEVSVTQMAVVVPVTTKDFGLFPIPKRLQHDSSKPVHYGFLLHMTLFLTVTFSEFCFTLNGGCIYDAQQDTLLSCR